MFKPRKKGDVSPFDFQLQANGVAISDVAGSGGFVISLADRKTRTPKVSLYACTVQDAPTAMLRWTPISTHVDTPGVYLVEVKQTRADGSVRPFPSSWYGELEIQDTLA